MEATVSGAYDGFVDYTQARWVGFKLDQGGPPASVENDDVAAHLDRGGVIRGGGGGARRGDKTNRSWTEFGAGFTKVVSSVLFGNSGVN